MEWNEVSVEKVSPMLSDKVSVSSAQFMQNELPSRAETINANSSDKVEPNLAHKTKLSLFEALWIKL